ncbi:DUF2948 family protein [Caulobacter segnis]|uniref:DUF2948 family protein n=1 Tax=Caulobacter segnis TaxID=88688 RepID=UPI0024103FCB|nr:DUF2948 family protein [Caulobacter segnis]MDG2522880.1 DUF2948 family protein [Caulobacter segnis]
MASAPLRLLAHDDGDLAVISAALQDALSKIGDITWEPSAKRLTLAFNRYRWEAGGKGKGGERVRSALQLAHVQSVQARKLRRDAKGAVVELLSISFEAGAAPGGTILFNFAGGGDLRAEVECIDAILADVSEPWRTSRTPGHDV